MLDVQNRVEERLLESFTNIKLFIFDLDGPIVKLQIKWTEVKKKIKKILKTNLSLTPLIPSIEELVTDSELKRRIYKAIDDEEMKVVKKLKFDEDILKLFKKLKKLGYKLALVTLQGRKPAIEALNRLNVREFFDLIISRDEKKDREEQIKTTLEAMEVPSSQVMVIADKLKDMVIAKKLGCVSMAITGKVEMDGDFKLNNIKEMLRMLEVN
jgi:phosphoglycolate phosphatase-like HAD superfamily hydrolase